MNNPNDASMSGVTLADQLDGASCVIAAGGSPISNPITVAPGESVYMYECDLPEGTSATSSGTNTVAATWDAEAYYGTDGEANASAEYDFASVTPTITDETVTVTDDMTNAEGEPKVLGEVNVMQSPQLFEYDLTLEPEEGTCTVYTNTAAVHEDTDGNGMDESSVDFQVCIEQGLMVAKSADAQYLRDYDWSVLKDAKQTQFKVEADGQATAEYTVEAKLEGYEDRKFTVNGEITVANPNDFKDAEVLVEDKISLESATCTIEGLSDGKITIPAGETSTLNYSCSFDEPVAEADYSGQENLVNVSWSDENWEAQTVSATAPLDFEATEVHDEKVTVLDDYANSDQQRELGTVTADEKSKKFTYTMDLAGVAGKCQTWTNTATVEESSSQDENNSDSADVEVCSEAPQAAPPAEPEPPAAPPARPTPLAATGMDEGLLWLVGSASMIIIAGALMLLRYRRRTQ